MRPRTIGENVETRAFAEINDTIDHLADRLAFDRQACCRRIGHADAGKQEAHIVVNLGDRADRRTRVARGGFLLDRDGRRQAVDLVDIGLLHHLEKLPGIDGVECERRLSRTGQAGHDNQLVARQIEVDALQIMLARAADGNGLEFAHRAQLCICIGKLLFKYGTAHVEAQSEKQPAFLSRLTGYYGFIRTKKEQILKTVVDDTMQRGVCLGVSR